MLYTDSYWKNTHHILYFNERYWCIISHKSRWDQKHFGVLMHSTRQLQSLNFKHYHTKRCHSQTVDKDSVLTSWSITTDKIDMVGKYFRPDLQMEVIMSTAFISTAWWNSFEILLITHLEKPSQDEKKSLSLMFMISRLKAWKNWQLKYDS